MPLTVVRALTDMAPLNSSVCTNTHSFKPRTCKLAPRVDGVAKRYKTGVKEHVRASRA